MLLHLTSHRGPMRIQQDFFSFMFMPNQLSSIADIDALNVLYAQLTRDLFTIAKFLSPSSFSILWHQQYYYPPHGRVSLLCRSVRYTYLGDGGTDRGEIWMMVHICH